MSRSFPYAALLFAAALISPQDLWAHSVGTHKAVAVRAAADLACAPDKLKAGESLLPPDACSEMEKYRPFLSLGAAMEDDHVYGQAVSLNGVELQSGSEEEAYNYKYCSPDRPGEEHAYCNHYFFMDPKVSHRGLQGCMAGKSSILNDAAGHQMVTAKNNCDGMVPTYLDILSRATLLWQNKVIPLYGKDKARSYYWLGRVAHLLADASVPGHVKNHFPLNTAVNLRTEVQHRCQEKSTLSSLGRIDSWIGAAKEQLYAGPAGNPEKDLPGLFTMMAVDAYKWREAVSDKIQAHPYATLHNILKDAAFNGLSDTAYTQACDKELDDRISDVVMPPAIRRTALLFGKFWAYTHQPKR